MGHCGLSPCQPKGVPEGITQWHALKKNCLDINPFEGPWTAPYCPCNAKDFYWVCISSVTMAKYSTLLHFFIINIEGYQMSSDYSLDFNGILVTWWV